MFFRIRPRLTHSAKSGCIDGNSDPANLSSARSANPKQEKSRERLEAILNVTMDLISRKGIDAVTMREIASMSGGPIASLYQYFPDKNAIFGKLYRGYVRKVTRSCSETLSDVSTRNEAFLAADKLVGVYIQFLRENRFIIDLLDAVQEDKRLAARHVQMTRLHARLIFRMTRFLVHQDAWPACSCALLLLVSWAPSVVNVILKSSSAEASEFIAMFKNVVRAPLDVFLSIKPH